MAIKTTEELEEHLRAKDVPFTSVIPLTGGSSNYVWRLTSPSGQTSIIKHAEPFLAGRLPAPFPVERQDFEARALTTFPALLPYDETITLPRLLNHDKEHHDLQLEDMGGETLHDRYQDPNLDIKKIGESIGRWLARLHKSTTHDEIKRQFDNPVATKMYKWHYINLAPVLEKYGFDPALGERMDEKYGSLLKTDDVCVCQGDMWPGNVLILGKNGSGELKLAIIDWEAARTGDGATEVGRFAGESFFLDRLRGGRGLLGAFLKGYVEEKALSAWEKERIVAQFGVQVAFWPSIYVSLLIMTKREVLLMSVVCQGWIKDEEKGGCVAYGKEVLERVEVKDWEWFKHSDLGVVFHETSS